MSDLIRSPNISTFIKSQFPRFYDEEGPQFIAFMESYYEWLEQEGNPTEVARDLLNIRDIDDTDSKYIKHFSNKYLNGLPMNIAFNKRFLIKHVLDVYRAKGSIRGYKLLFKILYDDEIEIYLPSRDLMAPSDNKWYEPKYLEIDDNPDNLNLTGKIIRSTGTQSVAVVESVVRQPVNNKIINIVYLSNITGGFEPGEKIISQDHDFGLASLLSAPKVQGSVTGIKIVQGGQRFKVGDVLVGTSGSGTELEARVARVANGTGTLAISVGYGGTLFSMDAVPIITRDPSDRQGRGASFAVGSITNIQTLTYNSDIIVDRAFNVMAGNVTSISVLTGGTGYVNSQPIIVTPRYHIDDIFPLGLGSNYANGDIIRITSNTAVVNGYATIATTNTGQLYSVDILTPGIFTSNVAPTLNITSSRGSNGTFKVTLSNPGSGATGYIVTRNDGSVANARITTVGTNYVAQPTITVGNTSGSGATFQANVEVDLMFNDNQNKSTLYTPIDYSLTFVTKNFGTIGSLTRIATGNNYTSTPKSIVRDLTYTRNQLPGVVYYSNTSQTVTGVNTQFDTYFTPGDFVKLTADPATNLRIDNRIVQSVTNATCMILDDTPAYSSNGALNQVFVVSTGSGYQNTDSVMVSGPGTGANVSIVTDSAGRIINAKLNRGGSGYYTLPSIIVNSMTGAGANLYATSLTGTYNFGVPVFESDNDLIDYNPSFVSDGTIPGQNESILSPPIFGVGIIRDVVVKNAGFGYMDGEYISLATYGAISQIYLDGAGTGYANTDSIVFSGGSPLSPAKASITTDANGKILYVSVNYYGSGYKYVPEIRIITRDGTGASLRATIGGLNNQFLISGNIVKSGLGTTKGTFTSTKGFPSSNKYIQDSYYYQDFSYEIQSSLALSSYEGTVKQIYHPSGTEMFGKVVKTDYIPISSSVVYDEVVKT